MDYLGHLVSAYVSQQDYYHAEVTIDEKIKIYTNSNQTNPGELANAYLVRAGLQQLMGDSNSAQTSAAIANVIIEKFNIKDPVLLSDALKEMAWLRIFDKNSGKVTSGSLQKNNQSEIKTLIMQALNLVYASKNLMSPASYQSRTYWLLKMFAASSTNPDVGIVIFKKIVNDHQHKKIEIMPLGDKYIDLFSDSVAEDYTMLSSLLSQQGRDAEALQVLNMLKQHEFFDFIRRSEKYASSSLPSIDYSPDELSFVSDLDRIQKKIEITSASIRSLQINLLISPNPSDQTKLELAMQENQRLSSQLMLLIENPPIRPGKARKTITPSLDSSISSAIAASKNKAVHITYWISDNKLDAKLNLIISDSKRQESLVLPITAEQKVLLESLFPATVADVERDPRPISKAVYDLMISPVAQRLRRDGVKNLIISLNGPLRYIPFSALYDGNKYLIENFEISTYNNLAGNRLADQDATEWQALAMGVTKSIGSFPALPGVRDEIESIIKQKGTNGVLPGVIQLDNDFTKAAFFDSTTKGYEALHIASHFVFSPGTEANSFLLLGDGTQLSLGDLRLQNIDLSGVDLVTLSACETGAGGGISGDGKEIDGLSGVLQTKGARAVIASLWPVADKSTAILMKNMYRRKQDERLSKSEALRQAQLDLLYGRQMPSNSLPFGTTQSSQSAPARPYAHPYYWAPFFLSGNWQ